MEFKRDARTDEYVAIETNVGRPAGLCAMVEASGVEMLHAVYCDLAGLPLPTRLHQGQAGIKCLDLRHDLQSAWWYWRRGELTIGDWWRSLRGVRAHGVWSWSDPVPMIWDFWRAARKAAGITVANRPAR
jgi:predicted ATP-grasp superfamily ATP-dependent carboligase